MVKAVDDDELQFERLIRRDMTNEAATLIRSLRVDQEYTWRAVARDVARQWGRRPHWRPVGHQIAGMALCKVAAERFGENFMSTPWN